MIRLNNSEVFKKAIEGISNLISQTNVRFTDDGIEIKALDDTQILMVDFFMSKQVFDSYSVDSNLVGLNILELYNMVSRSFLKDKLKLNLLDSSLEISLTGQLHRKFNLPYLDISYQELELPKTDYKTKITLSANYIKEILKDVSLVANTIIFKIENKKLIIRSYGDKGEIEVTVPKIKVNSNDNFSSKYSLSYLKNIFKSIDSNDTITLSLSSDSPLLIEHVINENIKINYYLSSMLL